MVASDKSFNFPQIYGGEIVLSFFNSIILLLTFLAGQQVAANAEVNSRLSTLESSLAAIQACLQLVSKRKTLLSAQSRHQVIPKSPPKVK